MQILLHRNRFQLYVSENNLFDSKREELVLSQNEKNVKLFVHPSHRRQSQKQMSRTSVAFDIVCVCVCFLPIHSGHQVRWTYQPGSHRISHPPSFCGVCLNFSREKDSAIPFPRRP